MSSVALICLVSVSACFIASYAYRLPSNETSRSPETLVDSDATFHPTKSRNGGTKRRLHAPPITASDARDPESGGNSLEKNRTDPTLSSDSVNSKPHTKVLSNTTFLPPEFEEDSSEKEDDHNVLTTQQSPNSPTTQPLKELGSIRPVVMMHGLVSGEG